MPVYDEKYIKTKVKEFNGLVLFYVLLDLLSLLTHLYIFYQIKNPFQRTMCYLRDTMSRQLSPCFLVLPVNGDI